jgi:hypothetical protein
MSYRLRLAACFTLLLVAAGFVGCGGSSLPTPVQRLPGKWHGQMIVFEEEVQGKYTPEQIADFQQMQMDFEFKPDGSMSIAASSKDKSDASQAKWELVKQDGDVLTIKSTEATGKQKHINCEFDGTDTFYMPVTTEVAELGAFRFTRLR